MSNISYAHFIPFGFISITHNGDSDYPELSQMTLIVKEGSEAEQYAKDHNIAYRYKWYEFISVKIIIGIYLFQNYVMINQRKYEE